MPDFNLQQKSPRMWVHLVAVYWVSLVTYYLLWKAYKHVSEIRAAALMSSEVRAEEFAILVRDIPLLLEGETRKEQVNSYFKAIYPDTFYRSMIITDNSKVGFNWNSCKFLPVLITLFCSHYVTNLDYSMLLLGDFQQIFFFIFHAEWFNISLFTLL